MNNKQQINRLRDNAELAWAAYGYFHFANPNYDFNKDEIDKERLKHFRKLKAKELGRALDENTYPTHADILNIEHKYFRDKNSKPQDSWYHKHFLGGDFTPTQAKNFFERYDLLKHCPNTDSGFSATLFKDLGEFDKKANTRKADSKDLEYTLAIRGTEFKLEQIQDLLNDYYIGTNNNDRKKA